MNPFVELKDTPIPTPKVLVQLDEEEQQMMLLALAELASRRPEWGPPLTAIALKLDGSKMFFEFKSPKQVQSEEGRNRRRGSILGTNTGIGRVT